MVNVKKAFSALIILVLLIAFAGTVFYYNSVVSGDNSKIESLKNEISNLTSQVANMSSQITNLTSQITDLTSANLVTALGIKDTHNPLLQYNFLLVTGSVNNTGKAMAYNAGLYVVAYAADGSLLVNMTLPVGGGWFGTDAEINAYVSNRFGVSSMELRSLFGGQATNVLLAIFHEGVVSNWTVKPVWTNS